MYVFSFLYVTCVYFSGVGVHTDPTYFQEIGSKMSIFWNNVKSECKELGKFPTSGNISLNPEDLCWLTAASCVLSSSMGPDNERTMLVPPTWQL